MHTTDLRVVIASFLRPCLVVVRARGAHVSRYYSIDEERAHMHELTPRNYGGPVNHGDRD